MVQNPMVLNQPLVFMVPQPVSKILNSFLVQNVYVFSAEFISEEISGARQTTLVSFEKVVYKIQ